MKILFLSDVPIQNPTSGAEQVLYQHVTGLALKQNNIFAITRANRNFKSIELKSYDSVQDACYSVNTSKSLRSLLAILKKPPHLFDMFRNAKPFSLVISHQPLTCFSLIRSGKLKKIPLLYICHSPSHLEYELLNEGKNLKYWPQVFARKWIEGYCLKKSSKIMVLSRYMKHKIQHIHQIPSNHFDVNPGGVDLNHFRPFGNRKQIKREVRFPENKMHLLTVRNLEPRMGVDNLIKSIKVINSARNIAHLTICGVGSQKRTLQKLINELDLTKDVTLTGFVPTESLPKFYNAADFFIIPTRKLEGFGLVTLESMACGTPVVGTPVGGTKEILSNFEPEFLFSDSTPEAIADGIPKIMEFYFSDRNKYKSLRARCREHVRINYSWRRHIDQLNALMAETLDSHDLVKFN